jgi:cardiolipin synthase A/B
VAWFLANWYLWLLSLDIALRGILAVRVIMRRAQVSIALAWLVVLLFVPLAGVPAYLLIGEVRLGTRRARRHARLTRDLEERAGHFWRGGDEDWTGELGDYRPISRLCEAVTNLPPLRGNALRLIADSRELIDAMIRDVEHAKAHVDLLTYIWMDPVPGSAGERFGRAMITAGARGVRCRVLVDSVGSKRFLRSVLAREMRAAGVQIVEALPASIFRAPFSRIDVRNHRKIMVIDGWTAYCGSQNITDETFGRNERRNIGPWIDATLRVEGPAAQALGVVFRRDWELDTSEPPERVEAWAPNPRLPEAGCIVQVVPTGPGEAARGRGRGLHEALLSSFYAARREIIITTPYFVPDEASLSALIAAAMRGVTVRVVVPARIDNRLVALASRSHFGDLLDAGVRIFEHQRGLLHAKTISIDTDVALVGSANMDMRSYFLNFEATLFVYDDDFASHLRMLQIGYIDESREVHLDRWNQRSLAARLADNAARLLGPLL